MEFLCWLLCVFIVCGICLYSVAIIMFLAKWVDEKIGNWLTNRALRKKFGNKWEL